MLMEVFKLVDVFVFIKLCLPGGFIQRGQRSSNGFPLRNGESGFSETGDAAKDYLYHNHSHTNKEPCGYLPVVSF
jgi:hypothetical protein